MNYGHKRKLQEARASRPKTCHHCYERPRLNYPTFGYPGEWYSKDRKKVWFTACPTCKRVWYTPENDGFYICYDPQRSMIASGDAGVARA